MKLLKAMVAQGNAILSCDVLEHEGALWLVPEWLESRAEGWMTPVRIIRLDYIPHQRTGDEIVVTSPIPKSVFDGQVPKELAAQYEVIESPGLRVPTPPVTH